MTRAVRPWIVGLAMVGFAAASGPPWAGASVTREEVERAIAGGVRCLKRSQKPDGSWVGPEGLTSLVTLALMSAGESPDSAAVAGALGYLRGLPGARQVDNTYAIALQTMVFAAAGRREDLARIESNAEWLVAAQIKPGPRVTSAGLWSYTMAKGRGDQSNSQYALLGLHAAREAGVAVPPAVWTLARNEWTAAQSRDGSWGYLPWNRNSSTGSMTCAGISSLIIAGLKHEQSRESLRGDHVEHCGQVSQNDPLQRAFDWMGANFQVKGNIGQGVRNRFYYLYGMERAGRLSGRRYFGRHDWYREGAEALVAEQNTITGGWRGAGLEGRPEIATSFALLFLAKGRAPVLVNKLAHGPDRDWDNDPDDVRHLVDHVSRDWKALLTWQVVDPDVATVEELLQAPVAYFSGHRTPEFSPEAVRLLRDYVEQGGFILADACCHRAEFDQGFRALIKAAFPEPECTLHRLDEDHPVWRAKHRIDPGSHPLWGVDRGCRTVVIYSPADLSCYWNQAENEPTHAAVGQALDLGQNILEYATGREIPADKLSVRAVVNVKGEAPKFGALRIAKLQHGGQWNVAPMAAPRLALLLRDKLGFDVVVQPKSLVPGDSSLAGYPLVYMHGRSSFSFSEEDLVALRRHLEPGGGTLFADAACGSEAFDSAFRVFVARLLPGQRLVPIPNDDEIYTEKMGYDLSTSEFSRAAGGGRGFPRLEGIRVDGHWGVIYSRLDLGCALERQLPPDCKGYTTESAGRIALNIVSYSTLP